MQPFLNEVNQDDLKTPIKDYEIFRKDKVAAYIETQKNRQLISKVNQLYADEEYTLVKDVLLVNLELTSNSNKIPALTETRLYHLLMMVRYFSAHRTSRYCARNCNFVVGRNTMELKQLCSMPNMGRASLPRNYELQRRR